MNLFILPHLGLGDAIIINGLVRTLIPQYEYIVMAVKHHNEKSVEYMFSDLVDKFYTVACDDDNEAREVAADAAQDGRVLRLGGHEDRNFLKGSGHFDEEFYRQAKVPFGYRWGAFKLPERPDDMFLRDRRGCALICDDQTRGFKIRPSLMPVGVECFRPFRTHTIFDWLPVILAAKEIHCIDSAFLNLVESLDLGDKPLFFHRYARPHPDERLYPTLRKNWTVIP